ncbi:hypothetical protein L21SP3_01080 [Sedimentisphaera cyanobacteriorum]|uniref:Dockerin domain-containing protein n=1 Tax=Sedimentisphaera cyanobacteriorum TaxID=1940790 RepID=A0A1Q2HPA3_9BACT|nr:dockerin type I domain-containing protein [Sedimentisphaera cyanobacteriorum]AQQ09277.1 hypothetical protein L21SP3_01080 [Sedimentisphaera cyanobacteriorum]
MENKELNKKGHKMKTKALFMNVTAFSLLCIMLPCATQAASPEWENPQGYDYSMCIYAQVFDQQGNQIAFAPDSAISAWTSEGTISGCSAEPVDSPAGTIFAFQAFYDLSIAEDFSLKVYDRELDEVFETEYIFDFETGSTLGDVVNPVVVVAKANYLPCDFNEDGFVDLLDLALLQSEWLSDTSLESDLNSDGKVDIKDFQLFYKEFEN